MKFIPILILSLFLSGCAFFKKDISPVTYTNEAVRIDSSALEYCSLLKDNLVISTFEDAIVAYSDVATLYATCSNKQTTSVKLLKQFEVLNDFCRKCKT